MLKDRLRNLFHNYDPAIRQLIAEVGEIEQAFISYANPRGIMSEIDELVTRIAQEEIARQEKDKAIK